ncbi:MAG TPA: TetR/AcrR family transcriptional regulator [Albitalea sp.]|nr:TetR/AcrR family transcriptional regulator [Albitalea sp.]
MPRRARPAAAPSPRGRQRSPTAGTDEKRERILQVAQRLFHEHGYADTTIERIAHELGVTKPYVYYYFHNKQEIFELLSWRPTVECFTALDLSPEDQRPAHEKVAQALQTLIRVCVQHHPAAFFAYREPQVFRPEMRAAQKKLANHFYDRLCTLLDEARRDGTLDFGDTKLTALAACSLAGFMYSWYRPDGRLPPEAVVQELSRLAWRVIGLRRGRRRSMPRA